MARRTSSVDSGASLILAMIFMSVVSLISLAMAAWATTGLHSTISFTAAQSTVSTANSVAEVTLQEVRGAFYTNTIWAQPPVSCWGPTNWTPLDLQGINNSSLTAYCSTAWPYDGSNSRRQVTISICPTPAATPTSADATKCATAPYLQVVATFDDRPASGSFPNCNNEPTYQSSYPTTQWSSCGTFMTINSWVFGTNPPTVAANGFSLGGITSTCTSTDSFTLGGTGFIAGLIGTSPPTPATKVYFVSNKTVNGSLIMDTTEATSVTVASGSLLAGCVPNNSPNTANVVVVTPVGESFQVLTVSY